MTKEIFLLDLEEIFKDNQTKARIFGLNPQGKREEFLIDFDPYFYVLPETGKERTAAQEIRGLLLKEDLAVKEIRIVRRRLNGQEQAFLKIVCFSFGDVAEARDLIKALEKKRGGQGRIKEEYEYSLSFSEQFLLEKQIYEPGWLEIKGQEIKIIKSDALPKFKVLAFDLEVAEEKGEEKIVMVSFWGPGFKRVIAYKKDKYPPWVRMVKNEKTLLAEFVRTIKERNPDIVLTYNGDFYDFAFLRERGEALKVKMSLGVGGEEFVFVKRGQQSAGQVRGRVHLDLYRFVKNLLAVNLQTETLGLGPVCAELLGDKKIDFSYHQLLEAWKKQKNLKKMARYCLKDSELVFKLFEFLLPHFLEAAEISGHLLFDISRISYSQLVEGYLSKRAHQQKQIIPNQPKFSQIQQRKRFTFKGGYVKEPIAGLHENLAVVDFASLYPSIIASFNISPENLNCQCCQKQGFMVPETGDWFCQKKKGFVSEIIKELVGQRQQIKKQLKARKLDLWERRVLNGRQEILKTIANATYGYFSYAGSKWYCQECALAAAAWGRSLIKEVMAKSSRQFEVIYSDTDSEFIKPQKGKTKRFASQVKKFLKEINQDLPGLITLELRGFYPRGIFIAKETGEGTAKKRYALIDKQGKLLVRGLEVVRRDWCRLAKNIQQEVLKLVLKDKNIAEAKKYVQRAVVALKKRKVALDDLIIYERLTKPIEDYKLISPHVAVALKLKAQGEKVEPGKTIMFVIGNKGETISARALPVSQTSLKEIDVEYYIYNQVLPAALRILSVFGVKQEELISAQKKLSK